MAGVEVDLELSDAVELAIGADEVHAICAFVLAEEGVERDCYVSVSVVTDEEMRVLNRDWRGIDRATDVLSLECERPDDPDLSDDEPAELGDIVLAPAYLARQAERFETSEANETRLMLVHALLHLLGYDHIAEDEALVMEAREDELLARLSSTRSMGPVTLTRHEHEVDR